MRRPLAIICVWVKITQEKLYPLLLIQAPSRINDKWPTGVPLRKVFPLCSSFRLDMLYLQLALTELVSDPIDRWLEKGTYWLAVGGKIYGRKRKFIRRDDGRRV